VESSEDGKRQVAFLKRYTVFNAEQIDGIEAKYPTPRRSSPQPIPMSGMPSWTRFSLASPSPLNTSDRSPIISRAAIMWSCPSLPISTPAMTIIRP
jgi:hypothetical protein